MNRLADYLYILARYTDAIQADKVERSENTQVSGDKKERPTAENQGTQSSEAVIQEVLKRMGIQGRITLDSAKRLIEKIEKKQNAGAKSSDRSLRTGGKSHCSSRNGRRFSGKLYDGDQESIYFLLR